MSLPIRLTIGAMLVFALFALWQASVEYNNYSSVLNTVPIDNDDPFTAYRIGAMETASPQPSPTAPPATATTSTTKPIRTTYHRATPTTAGLPTNTPSATARATATSAPTFTATASAEPSLTPTAIPTDSEYFLRVEPQNPTWHDTITLSWRLPADVSTAALNFNDPHLEGFLLFGMHGIYESNLPIEGSKTISLEELTGNSCQSPYAEWTISAYQQGGGEFTRTATHTISYADVPFTLNHVSLSANPAPAYAPITMT